MWNRLNKPYMEVEVKRTTRNTSKPVQVYRLFVRKLCFLGGWSVEEGSQHLNLVKNTHADEVCMVFVCMHYTSVFEVWRQSP